MRHLQRIIVLQLCIFCCTLLCAQTKSDGDSRQTIEKKFKSIPDEQRLAVYWYWMSDNISKEGVIKDLKAMKAAGINRAYIGNIGEPSIPYGKVKFLSDEWWDVLHTALKTATELNIEIGIFNSPGWSQSGGPWVKPSQSMRYLASSQVKVAGPMKFKQLLPAVGKDAQDVKVIAYRDIEPTCSFIPRQDLRKADVIDLVSPEAATVRSLTIQTILSPCKSKAELFVNENGDYRSVCKFEIDRSNHSTNVGFIPYAPIVISIPEVKGSEFRLVIDKASAGIIDNIQLSNVPKVERFPEKTLAKMFQTPHPMFYDYVWSAQPESTDKNVVVPVNDVIDITKYFDKDGTLTWNVPKGKWVIMRTAMLTTGQTNSPAAPEAVGLETDKMSEKHIRAHFNAYIGEILRRIPETDRKTFKVVVEDSYETGGQNWTDLMMDDFIQRYGYSPVPFLPVFQGVVVGSEDQSDRFLWDVRRLIADEVSYNYVGGLRKISNEHGLTTWLENYGHWGFPGEFLQYGGQSDEIAGEFWSVGDLGNIENKAASSCGHIYGKPKVWAESFTCGGPDFFRYPGEMKKRGDRFFTEGINSTLLHVYIEQPDERVPGINAPYGNEFNRHNTWFSQLDVFAKYLKRCNYMLQQGRYIADVAYFIGEDTPKMTGLCDPALPKGYSFDYINAEILMNKAHVENGMLKLNSGMEYRVLVLPKMPTMRPEVLRRIKQFVNDGLIILGPAPTRSPSLQNYPSSDKEVLTMAKELWNGNNAKGQYTAYGKGKVYSSSSSLEDVFNDIHLIPDFATPKNAEPLLFIHRKISDGDIYFISNQSDSCQNFNAKFRVKDMTPELWNPQTAEVRLLPECHHQDTYTEIPFALQPYESAFVVFGKSAKVAQAAEGKNFPEKHVEATITAPWLVSFQEGRGAPESSVTFSTLTDWTANADARIKYFSGTALYKTTFKIKKLPAGESYIDLGKVMVMAKVKLNGEYVGGVWTSPYQLNITKYLKKGKNELEVEVVNNWMNRLIYDKKLPEEEKITWQTVSYNHPDTPLQSSGLLGPVEIESYNYILKK
jgi:hypothetical protein